MKVGIFGGTFDPIHIEHINMALSAKEELGLDKFLLTGAGLKNTKPTNAMMADAFESIVASIYLDGGLDKARVFVLTLLESSLQDIKATGVPESNKSLLQERFKTSKIYYETKHSGEGQEKTYTATVYINGLACGVGVSGKKRFAEDIAAKEALLKTKKR